MSTTTTCPQWHEIDLHQVGALIVNSLTNDDRDSWMYLSPRRVVISKHDSHNKLEPAAPIYYTVLRPSTTLWHVSRRIALLKKSFTIQPFRDAFERGGAHIMGRRYCRCRLRGQWLCKTTTGLYCGHDGCFCVCAGDRIIMGQFAKMRCMHATAFIGPCHSWGNVTFCL
jgi:hypothetical protein